MSQFFSVFWGRAFDEQEWSNYVPIKGFFSALIASLAMGVIHINIGGMTLLLYATAFAILSYYASIKSGFFDVPAPLKNSGSYMDDEPQFIMWISCTFLISLNIMALIFMRLYGYHIIPKG